MNVDQKLVDDVLELREKLRLVCDDRAGLRTVEAAVVALADDLQREANASLGNVHSRRRAEILSGVAGRLRVALRAGLR